ncbi:MAG: metalloregulator ArsR/SmtB family transcription factor, partial [Pseudonocardia sp.]
MGDAVLKAELFEQLARVGKALGSGKRLELLDLLSQGPRSVADLAATAGLGLTTASMHLKVLRESGLVATTRAGTTIRYRLAGDDVAALFARLRGVAAAHLADVGVSRDRYLGTQDGEDTEAVGRAELLRRVEGGQAIVLDVRPAPEFAAGHI